MTMISRDDVAYLATLSNLQLGEQEAADLQQDLEHIIEYIHQLDELDTSGVEPTYQVSGLENVSRDDLIDTYGLAPEALLALAPLAQDNQVKVPKVL
ncbi:MAG: putative Aspartyl/glutamyl-tRNA(Asn/Gln) amidotransferase subunit [Candidatus Saccharibacteria bacterium]|nr:putative Aspartyl/glutamyl-tRNA(Asn/Gln) amidotransferase subunit [Candidatus Saccharibacteria bacterium]